MQARIVVSCWKAEGVDHPILSHIPLRFFPGAVSQSHGEKTKAELGVCFWTLYLVFCLLYGLNWGPQAGTGRKFIPTSAINIPASSIHTGRFLSLGLGLGKRRGLGIYGVGNRGERWKRSQISTSLPLGECLQLSLKE